MSKKHLFIEVDGPYKFIFRYLSVIKPIADLDIVSVPVWAKGSTGHCVTGNKEVFAIGNDKITIYVDVKLKFTDELNKLVLEYFKTKKNPDPNKITLIEY